MEKPKVGTILYRYVDRVGPYGRVEIILEEYVVERETEAGVWVKEQKQPCIRGRWMKYPSTEQFAWETKEAAIEDFISRKRKQLAILDSRLMRERISLEAAKIMARNLDGDPDGEDHKNG